MRLNRYIAKAGVASRRGADDLVFGGQIKVNGQEETNPAYRVQEGDVVSYQGRELYPVDEKVYYLLYKPKGVISSVKDPHHEKTVLSYVQVNYRIFPVGRLDKDSEGLILLTNDGNLTQKMTHPRYGLDKTYEVAVAGSPGSAEIEALEKGIIIDDYQLEPCQIERLWGNSQQTTYHVVLWEGRNRQIRKMFEAIGYPVVELKRIRIGKIEDINLEAGQYRPLTRKEINFLKEL